MSNLCRSVEGFSKLIESDGGPLEVRMKAAWNGRSAGLFGPGNQLQGLAIRRKATAASEAHTAEGLLGLVALADGEPETVGGPSPDAASVSARYKNCQGFSEQHIVVLAGFTQGGSRLVERAASIALVRFDPVEADCEPSERFPPGCAAHEDDSVFGVFVMELVASVFRSIVV